jgi:hypothetical protein
MESAAGNARAADAKIKTPDKRRDTKIGQKNSSREFGAVILRRPPAKARLRASLFVARLQGCDRGLRVGANQGSALRAERFSS